MGKTYIRSAMQQKKSGATFLKLLKKILEKYLFLEDTST